ncbi:MAG: outer membrane protein [Longimicrobiales bacterium]
MSSRARTLIAAVAVLALSPVTAQAQKGRDRDARSFAFSNWTLEARGGLANFGRFLLEDVLDLNENFVGQRELDASNSFVWGAGVSTTVLPRTALRLSFTRASADLNYDDDTGTDSNALDLDDIGDISSNVISLDVVRHILSDRAKVRPYGGAGFAVAWWNLGENADQLVVAGTDNTLFKWGANALLGLQFRPAVRWAIQLEATTMTLGNPFTGKKSFLPTTGIIIDEPTRVRQTNYTLGIAYTFGRLRRPVQADDR